MLGPFGNFAIPCLCGATVVLEAGLPLPSARLGIILSKCPSFPALVPGGAGIL